MDETEKVAFNRKRAEGGDKSSTRTLQLKTRKLNPVNTICYVQILGTGMDTQDTSPSVFLFFDKQRFIFNAGEGLQRFCTEHKIKLSKIDHMFLTRVCSETAGGLPGLLLTLAGIGEEGQSVNVWGPSDIKYLIDAMTTFIPNAAMVHTHKFGSTLNCGEISDKDFKVGPFVLVDDEVVKVSAILLRPGFSNGRQNKTEDCEILNSTDESVSSFCTPLVSCSQNSLGRVKAILKPGDISVIYACELPEIKGKFDPAKAQALGLKAGPKYRELQLGNSVQSDRQNIMVHPSDVLGPSVPGPIVLLVDCPTMAHLQEMLSLESLNDYYVDYGNASQILKSVNCVIHLGPASVTMTGDYEKWMKRFGGAQHIMAGHGVKNMEIPILKSSARIAARLNYLCPQLFPAPGFWPFQPSIGFLRKSVGMNKDCSTTSFESVPAENLLKFHLRPFSQLGLDKSGIPSALTSSHIVTELHSEIPEIGDVSRHVSQFWDASQKADEMTPCKEEHVMMVEEPWMNEAICKDSSNDETFDVSGIQTEHSESESDLPSCLENISREDMEIILLGTGSSQPSKYRNVSSIYINLFSKGSLLLDCGEGTLAQLKRRFGVSGADDAIRGLRCIWISHIHADHHTGLARILSVRSQLWKGTPHEPLIVIGPRQLKRFLDAYSRLEDIDMQFLDCRDTTEAAWGALAARSETGGAANQDFDTSLFVSTKMEKYWKRMPGQVGSLGNFTVLKRLKQVLLEAGLEGLTSFPVVHCPQAFGIVLKAEERINRVGKNIPGWKLVYSGDTRPCQALIDASHGATVLIHEATFEDAMLEEAVAKNHSTTKEAIEVGDAANVYRIILTHFSQRYPKIPVFDETHMPKTCIAFDMMSVNIADLPILPKVLPFLKLLFKNEIVPDESDEAPLAALQQLN
ncbi:tRNase Z TRZ3, mitochondrial-like isoform X2 [Aristolochia californica]